MPANLPEPVICQHPKGDIFHIVPYKGVKGWNAVIPSGKYAGNIFVAHSVQDWNDQIKPYLKYEVKS